MEYEGEDGFKDNSGDCDFPRGIASFPKQEIPGRKTCGEKILAYFWK